MEEKKIDKLYDLLENGNLDNETSAALKWAIYELENIYHSLEYVNPNEVTAEHLIKILKSYEPDAIVLNGKEKNISIYPGRRVGPGDGSVIMIC